MPMPQVEEKAATSGKRFKHYVRSFWIEQLGVGQPFSCGGELGNLIVA